MGEYIKRNKTEYKIGTCENLYYTTFQEYKKAFKNGELSSMGGNDTPANYLNGSYRFRFPFPDEDHVKMFGIYPDFDKSILFKIPKTAGIEICHGETFFRTDNTVKHAPAVGFNLPCIQSKDFTLKKYDWSYTANFTIFEIVQQKPIDGQLQVIVRCPYCRASCRLDEKEVNSFVSYVWKNRKAFTNEEVLSAIIAAKGYRLAV